MERVTAPVASSRHSSMFVAFVAMLSLVAVTCGRPDPDTSASTELAADSVEITVSGWQGQTDLWNDVILPEFERAHPGIDVVYLATAASDYREGVPAELAAGAGADVVGCFGFDWTTALGSEGLLVDLHDLPAMENFSALARAPWSSADGSRTYCVPAISNVTGFFYNVDVFERLGLSEPETLDEFRQVLDAIAVDGQVTPLGFGLKDAWVAQALAFDNIGPNHWDGEIGRLELISGLASFSDPEFVAVIEELASWYPYLPDNPEEVSRVDAQHMLFEGTAAIIPAGSWEIESVNTLGTVPVGGFPPPRVNDGDDCHITVQADLGFGLNAASPSAEQARTLLEWFGSVEFAQIYVDTFPGLISLHEEAPISSDPLAAEVLSWLDDCRGSTRIGTQVLSAGVNLQAEIATTVNAAMRGDLSGADAAARLDEALGEALAGRG